MVEERSWPITRCTMFTGTPSSKLVESNVPTLRISRFDHGSVRGIRSVGDYGARFSDQFTVSPPASPSTVNPAAAFTCSPRMFVCLVEVMVVCLVEVLPKLPLWDRAHAGSLPLAARGLAAVLSSGSTGRSQVQHRSSRPNQHGRSDDMAPVFRDFRRRAKIDHC